MSEIIQRPMLKIGQPYGSVIQEAYIVPDIEKAIWDFHKTLNIGPFFIAEHFPLINATYRGAPCDADVTLAIGFSGNMSYELIQQNNQAPSPWLETKEKRGWGFHHKAIACLDFEAELERYNKAGFETVLHSEVSFGTLAAYVDTTAANFGMIELIEMNEAVEDFFHMMKEAAVNWDGKDPIRRL